jgi:hypothetical protein
MRTDDLVNMLATGVEAIEPHVAARRFSMGLSWGAAGAGLLMLLLLGVRRDLGVAVMLPMFWVKVLFVACLLGVSLIAAIRLSQPGRQLQWLPGILAAPVLAMWVLAVIAVNRTEPVQRAELFWGDTWAFCPPLIAMLSIPVFIGVLWAMKELAPTQLRLAGAAAGLLSGSTAALVYCLHCPELAAPFVGFWYLLGMLIPTLVGASLGARLLRW